MRSGKLLFLTLLVLLIGMSNVFGAQEISVTPSILPAGAYVNLGGDVDADQYYWQMIYLKLSDGIGAVASAASDIVITLPSAVTIADWDGNGEEATISLVWDTANALNFSINAATDETAITIDGNTANYANGDELWIMFPVETDAEPGAGPHEYTVAFSAALVAAGNVDITGASTPAPPAVTFDTDGSSVGLITFDTMLTGGEDVTTDYGEQYPVGGGATITAILPDFIKDRGNTSTARVESDILKDWDDVGATTVKVFDAVANNVNDVEYTVWASQQDNLALVVPGMSGVQPLVNYTTSLVYTQNETDQFADAYAVSGLAEGEWYFYITSSVTSGWILGKSDKLTVNHYPWVQLVGWDLNLDNAYDELPAYDDDASITVDTGEYKRYDGSVDAGKGTTKQVDLYVKANDFDNNAEVKLFYSSDLGLDADDIRISGTSPNIVVEGLDQQGATAVLLIEDLFDDDKDPYLEYTWDLDVDSLGNFLPSGSYTVYAVANDGKHQDISSVKGHGVSTLAVNLVHSPSLVLDALAEYDSDTGTDGVQIDMAQNKTIMLSWGKENAIDGDNDIDDDCLISFYLYEDTSGSGLAATGLAAFSADDVNSLTGHANTQQIVTGIEEKYESKDLSYYEWDLETFSETSSWSPNDRAVYHLYAVIDENKSSGTSISRVVALGDVDGLLTLGEDLMAGGTEGKIQFINYSYARLATPPTKGATVSPQETFRFDFEAFDIDDNADIGIFIVKDGVTFGGTEVAPMTIQVGGGTLVDAGLVNRAVDEVVMLNSLDGSIAGGTLYLKEDTQSYYDFTLSDPSDLGVLRYVLDVNGNGAGIAADGDYFVYIGVDDQNWKKDQITVNNAGGITVGDWITARNGATGRVSGIAGLVVSVVYNTAAAFVDDGGAGDSSGAWGIAVGTSYDDATAKWITAVSSATQQDFSAEYLTLHRAPGMLSIVNISEANPQKNLMISPSNLNVSAGETTEIVLRAADMNTDDIDLIDFYVAVEKDYFNVEGGATPFTEYPAVGDLIANRVIDDTVNNRWILNATLYNSAAVLNLAANNEGTIVASFSVVSLGTTNDEKAETSIYYVNEPSKGWVTTYQSNGLKRAFASNACDVVVQPRPIIRGNAHFDGRPMSNYMVTFELREHGSYVPSDDTWFLAQNDADSNTAGVQYMLDSDGEFTLKQVPSGEWDLIVRYPRYLDELSQISVYDGLDTLLVDFGILRGGDAIGYTDSLGYSMPNNRIDLGDITFINDSFLATSATAGWGAPTNKKYADINEDGEVEAADLSMVTKNYTAGVGNENDGAQPVYGKVAVRPEANNLDAIVELVNAPVMLEMGQAYTFQVAVRNAGDVRAYFVNLDYDADALNFNGIVKGDFIDADSYSFPVVDEGTAGLANSAYGDYAFAGDGVLAEVRFTSKVDGTFDTSMLHVTRASLVDSNSLGTSVVVEQPVDVDAKTPLEFSLNQNFPNPFNPTTTISFTIPSDDLVTLKVYDILGRHVNTLVSSRYSAGNYNVVWDARDQSGNMVSAGVYFYTIQAGNYNTTKRMLLLK